MDFRWNMGEGKGLKNGRGSIYILCFLGFGPNDLRLTSTSHPSVKTYPLGRCHNLVTSYSVSVSVGEPLPMMLDH